MEVKLNLEGLVKDYIGGIVRRGWAPNNAEAVRMTILRQVERDRQHEKTWYERAIKQSREYRGKKEKIGHDLIAYGVSRKGTQPKKRK